MMMNVTRRGGALAVVLILLIVLVAAAGLLIEVGTTRTSQTETQRAIVRARQLAEIGMGVKIHEMNNTEDPEAYEGADNRITGTTTDGDWFVAALLDAGAEAGRGPYAIYSLGKTIVGGKNPIVRLMKAKVRKPIRTEFDPGGALMLFGGDGTDANFGGNSFLISGNDRNLNGTTGPGDPKWGVTSTRPESAQNVIDALRGAQADNVIGVGTDRPCCAYQDEATIGFTEQDVVDLAEYFVGLAAGGAANTTYLDSSARFNSREPEVLGSVQQPRVVVIDGANVQLGGNARGAGVMIVKNGSLKMVGTARFDGLTIVLQDAVASAGEAGTPEVWGSLFVLTGQPGRTQLDIRGDASVQYSTEAIALSRQAIDSVVVFEVQTMIEIERGDLPPELTSVADLWIDEEPEGTGGTP